MKPLLIAAAVILSALLPGIASAQTPVFMPCYFSAPGTTTPIYLQVTNTAPFVQCEAITLDTSVITSRNTTGTVVVSALSGQPAHAYTQALQWPFRNSNTLFADPAGTSPASPFNGQVVWCASTTNASIQTFAAQIGSFLPSMLVEFRQAANATPVLTSTGMLAAQSLTNSGRYLWMEQSPTCGNIPGIVFTAAAASIVVGATTTPSTLINLVVVGLL